MSFARGPMASTSPAALGQVDHRFRRSSSRGGSSSYTRSRFRCVTAKSKPRGRIAGRPTANTWWRTWRLGRECKAVDTAEPQHRNRSPRIQASNFRLAGPANDAGQSAPSPSPATMIRPSASCIPVSRTWSLRLGGYGVGNDAQYTPSTTLETFPFPEGLTPDIPAAAIRRRPAGAAIASRGGECSTQARGLAESARPRAPRAGDRARLPRPPLAGGRRCRRGISRSGP